MMDKFVANFTNQIREAIAIGEDASLKKSDKKIDNVIITGLGGSGIGGKIVSELIAEEIKIPVIINNSYFLPKFASENTLVIVSSYSGNTEETVSVLKQAIDARCEIACVTSGGEVLEIAQKNKLNFIVIPGGNPPRSMLAYSVVQQLFILSHYDLISDRFKNELSLSLDLLDNNVEEIKLEAEKVAKTIFGKIPVIYIENSLGGVATRFKQQINENAKALCWDQVIPEMNHNELVGWAGGNENIVPIFLINESDYPRNKVRQRVSKEIMTNYTSSIVEIHSRGESIIQRALYLIHLTDWVSVYLGNLKKVDTIEVDVITGLKEELSRFNG